MVFLLQLGDVEALKLSRASQGEGAPVHVLWV